jgi:hypothetical protein
MDNELNRPLDHDDDFDQEGIDQKTMNRQAWKMLVAKGYTGDQKVRLEFVFVSEKRADAQKFKAHLESSTDYEVKVVNNDDEFEISGQTGELQLTLEAINQWTSWMVEEGKKCNCIFDGWTTALAMKKAKP